MTKTVPQLVANAQKQGHRERLESREWLCVKCRKRFRFRPEHIEHTLKTGTPPSPEHCGLPMLLTHKVPR
jgi:hypothetical protein